MAEFVLVSETKQVGREGRAQGSAEISLLSQRTLNEGYYLYTYKLVHLFCIIMIISLSYTISLIPKLSFFFA